MNESPIRKRWLCQALLIFMSLGGLRFEKGQAQSVIQLTDGGSPPCKTSKEKHENKQSVAEEKISRLRTGLCDKSAAVRKDAVARLGVIGQPAIPYLLEALRDRDPSVRSEAAYALGQIGKRAKVSVPKLIDLLEHDSDLGVRAWGARALGAMGAEAEVAVPALTASVKSEQMEGAIWALGEIGPVAKSSVPVLIQTLNNRDWNVRAASALALGKIGRDAKAAVPALCAALNDKVFTVRMNAALALEGIGPTASAAIPILIKKLKGEADRCGDVASGPYLTGIDLRVFIASALASIKPNEGALIPSLVDMINDKDIPTRLASAEVLGKLGPRAKQAVPVLRTALKDENEYVREAAANALDKIIGK